MDFIKCGSCRFCAAPAAAPQDLERLVDEILSGKVALPGWKPGGQEVTVDRAEIAKRLRASLADIGFGQCRKGPPAAGADGRAVWPLVALKGIGCAAGEAEPEAVKPLS